MGSARLFSTSRFFKSLLAGSILIAIQLVLLSNSSLAGERSLALPVCWYEDDRGQVPEPDERDPNLLWDMINDSVVLPFRRLTDPVRLTRRAGNLFRHTELVKEAGDLNALDEVLNSTWFQNRIGLYPVSPATASLGAGSGAGPSLLTPWTIISAKNQGITPGFVIRDGDGAVFLIKFDPPGFLGMTTVAGVISGHILHTAGYNVPDDNVVLFSADDLVLGDDVKLKENGKKRPMTRADLDRILSRVDTLPDGRHLAISSRFVTGKPIGPFDYQGRRDEDPNDRLSHQHRRELRGLRLFAAWLGHFDTKQHNSLDTYHPDGHVKHYLIDFASTLGSGASGPEPRYGHELTFDLPAIAKRTLSLGFWEDPWRRIATPPGLPEIGYLESREFSPLAFDPQQPNSAFANCTLRDGYWAAKIISAFTDEHLHRICHDAGYRDPAAADFVAVTLGERREKIARYFFDRIPALDFFQMVEGVIIFHDLGVERGIYPATGSSYRGRLSTVGEDRTVIEQGEWCQLAGSSISLTQLPGFALGRKAAPDYFSLECQVRRDDSWSSSVIVYFSREDGRVKAVER